ncbi:MAG: RES family NAD+ phosphorylase [Gemmatimonadaceae bacterium]|nr:RES family NAD+ phosphorylase [Gemmatimonadaceae bacterium]
MRHADASEDVELALWRAVEAQHVVSTLPLVDTRAEQRLLEDLIESGKPALPAETAGLHYLLVTPFRYRSPWGSRFREPHEPGVLYGAESQRTACAELGYWRWRFLRDSPALPRLDPAPQTVFQCVVRGRALDCRLPPLDARRAEWTHPSDYAACQALGRSARAAGVAVIRYESVRDPEHGPCGAVLTPSAIAHPNPVAQETWSLDVSRERVRWWRAELPHLGGEVDSAWDFRFPEP